MDNLPPNSIESEMAVIGACLTDPQTCIAECQIVLTEMHFYDHRCRAVWGFICILEPYEVNLVTISQQLRDSNLLDKIGGIPFLTECQDHCHSPAHLPAWLGTLSDKFVLRRVISRCRDAIDEAMAAPDDGTRFLDRLETDILAIRPNQRKQTDVKSLVRESIGKLEERYENPDRIMGISTGLPDLDYQTDGIHPGELIVVAGYPSTGKTALAVQVAVGAALDGIPIGIFSAEMRPVQLVVRSMCSVARANARKLDERAIKRLVSTSGLISRAPIYIEPASGLTIGQIFAMARRMKQSHGVKIIVIDYIGLIGGVGDNKEQKTASVSAGCKAMALELDCAVLALSQLNDDGKMRDSRAVSQDADTVWKLENDGKWQPLLQSVNLNVEKCRDGETGQVKLTFLKTMTRFECVSKVSDEDVPEARYADV